MPKLSTAPWLQRAVVAAILTVSLAISWQPTTVCADDPEQLAQEIYGTVMSPFCPARLLTDCPSPSASELKVKILSELKAGKTKEQVLQELYTTFGSSLRAAPEARGFGALAWWIPITFVLGGAAIYAVWLSKRKADPHSEKQRTPSEISPEMQRRIETELNRFES